MIVNFLYMCIGPISKTGPILTTNIYLRLVALCVCVCFLAMRSLFGHVTVSVNSMRSTGLWVLHCEEAMSAVWTYFTVSREDTRIAVCNTCKVEVMRGGGRVKSFNTTNLMSHLKNRHPEVHKQCQEANVASKQAKTKTATAAVGSPIQQALDKTKKFAKDSAKAKSITNKVMEMIALDNQPFSIVEDRGFRQLIEHIEPRYSLPSRR